MPIERLLFLKQLLKGRWGSDANLFPGPSFGFVSFVIQLMPTFEGGLE
jgi:hypothetical protein